jgi:hypothetical protein
MMNVGAALAPDAGEILFHVHSGVGDLNPCLSAIFRSALAWMPHIYFERRSCAALLPSDSDFDELHIFFVRRVTGPSILISSHDNCGWLYDAPNFSVFAVVTTNVQRAIAMVRNVQPFTLIVVARTI